ncbi:MAG: hypothetical protein LBE15_04225 [Burkholderiales bacterium]|jgi:hypothetical protein|nr:hypothetical protein [Burkholderiales bacterium]
MPGKQTAEKAFFKNDKAIPGGGGFSHFFLQARGLARGGGKKYRGFPAEQSGVVIAQFSQKKARFFRGGFLKNSSCTIINPLLDF